MKKLLLSALLALCGIASWAQTGTHVWQPSDLTDGTVIALQCRDTNGGAGYFFSGGQVKSATLSCFNLFEVVAAADDKIKLKRCLDGRYVSAENTVTMVEESASNVATFTVTNPGMTDDAWGSSKMADTEANKTLRFNRGDGNFLNCQGSGAVPVYSTGTAGYSIWYVYTFTTAEVASLMPFDITTDATAVGTKWYTIHNGKSPIRYLGTATGYLDATGLCLSTGEATKTKPTSKQGWWCVMGDVASGFKFYNAQEHKYIGMTKPSSYSTGCSVGNIYAGTEEGVVTSWVMRTSACNPTHCPGKYYCFKFPDSGNAYWNDLGSKSNHLSIWNDAAAYGNDQGSAYTFDIAAVTVEITYMLNGTKLGETVKEVASIGQTIQEAAYDQCPEGYSVIETTTETVTADKLAYTVDIKAGMTYHFNQASGTWTKSNSGKTWASEWQSTKSPKVTIATGFNNMAYTNGEPIIYTGTGATSCDYTISVPEGYKIVSLSFNAARIAGEASSIVLRGVETPIPESGTVAFSAEGLNKRSVVFTEKTTNINKGVQLSDFIIEIAEADPEIKHEIFVYDNSTEHKVLYRIPSLVMIPAGAHKGRVVALTDYRPGGYDVGIAAVDIHAKYSDDNGATWSDEFVVIQNDASRTDGPSYNLRRYFSFGDPVSIADCESGEILVLSCSGNNSYPNGTIAHHQGIETYRSTDGEHWSAPVDVCVPLYNELNAGAGVISMFVGSGALVQSKYVKNGSHYRLYGGLLCRTGSAGGINYVIYSDDFGASWKVLGGATAQAVSAGGDEAKVEEMPDGSVLLSSRKQGGRIFNIWRWDDDTFTTGEWDGQQGSDTSNNGIVAGNNGTNGEILIVPAKRASDGKKMYLAMQSIPFGNGRANVGIYFKGLENKEAFGTTTDFAKNWTKGLQVSYKNSAYSAMILQSDGNIGFMVEEETNSGCQYSEMYHNLTIEEITDGQYVKLADGETIDESQYAPVYKPITLKANNLRTLEPVAEKSVNARVGGSIKRITTSQLTGYTVLSYACPERVEDATSVYNVNITDADYSVNYQNEKTNNSRYTSAVSLTYDGTEHIVSGLQQSANQNLYWDKTDVVFECNVGTSITPKAPQAGSAVPMGWMHSYCYVDENYDGFAGRYDIAEANISPDKWPVLFPSLKSFVYVNGKNSAKEDKTNGCGTGSMPAFSAPSVPGTYRVRMKIDWTSTDPKGRLGDDGTATGNNAITKNGGIIVDFMLKVNATQEQLQAAIASLPTDYSTHRGEVGGYTPERAAAIAGAIAAANAVVAKTDATQDEINNAYNTVVRLCKPDNMPKTGKFYRLKGGKYGKYIAATSVAASDFAPVSTAEDGSTIFYYDEGERLLNYGYGLYMTSTRSIAAVGAEGHRYAFATSTAQTSSKGVPYLTAQDLNATGNVGQWLYENDGKADRNSVYAAENCEWKLTELTELPLTVSGAKAATLCLPVACRVPAELKVYTATSKIVDKTTEKSLVLQLVEKEGDNTTLLPANQPVFVWGPAGEYSLDLNVDDSSLTKTANIFTGTKATITHDTSDSDHTMVLGLESKTNDLGFFRTTSTYINGFRAYLNSQTVDELMQSSTETSSARGMKISFGDITTAIEAAESNITEGATYDLNGRQVQNMGKGLYIVNGKKIMVK